MPIYVKRSTFILEDVLLLKMDRKKLGKLDYPVVFLIYLDKILLN